jgi:hypothetical protein
MGGYSEGGIADWDLVEETTISALSAAIISVPIHEELARSVTFGRPGGGARRGEPGNPHQFARK